MNLKLLNNYISEVKRGIIESGFRRDLDDYIESLPANSDNIVTLRKMGEDIFVYLEKVYGGDIPRYMKSLVPEELGEPFTATDYLSSVGNLLNDKSIKQDAFQGSLLSILLDLSREIDSNMESIDSLERFIKPYAQAVSLQDSEALAILSLIFHDDRTIHSLGHLTKSFSDWNRLLPVYHQLLRGDSPEDVKVVGVESGSIDLIINLNVDVALDLVEAIKVGMMAFASYLLYKKGVASLEKIYVNPRLIELEKEKDRLLLENIGEAVAAKISEQHEAALLRDGSISQEAVSKKIEQVAKLFTSHVVKGNDVKLLALPETVDSEVATRADESRNELRNISLETRRELAAVSGVARLELLDMYDREPVDIDFTESDGNSDVIAADED